MDYLTLTTCQGENTEPVCTAVSAYLSTHLQIPVGYEGSIPWQERARRLDSGEIEIGWICGLWYVQKLGHTAVPRSLLAAPIMAGEEYQQQPVYSSKMIVHRDSDFHTFADLRGARFAINEPNSLSGCVLIQAHLANLGETGDYFGDVVASGSHLQSMRWVANGRIDAAIIDNTLFNYIVPQQPEMQQLLRVIDVLGPSPIPPWVIADTVPASTRQAIRQCLLGMAADENGRDLLAANNITRFTAVTDKDYDPIRQIAREGSAIQWKL